MLSMSRPPRIQTEDLGVEGTSPHTAPPEQSGGLPIRRTSLAIAAARRFTLYNLAESPLAASPLSGLRPPSADSDVRFRNVFSSSPVQTVGFLGQISEDAVSPGPISPRSEVPSRCEPVSPRRKPTRRRSSGGLAPRYHWLSGGMAGNTGDEPGVDVRSSRDQEAYGHLRGPTHVTVVDYSSNPDAEDMNVRVDFAGSRLASWLDCPQGQRPMADGKPLGVRWSLNWEVIKTLTLRFNLHPLAVEDALRSSRSPHSKIDFYRNHLYLQMIVHHVHAPDREAIARAAAGLSISEDTPGGPGDIEEAVQRKARFANWRWPWSQKGAIRLPEGVESVFEPSIQDPVNRIDNSMNDVEGDAQARHRALVNELSAHYMVPIRKGIISVFMMQDGTIITVSAKDMHSMLEPVYERLEDEHSLLRRSGDPGILVHALLDISTDLAIEIIQAFEVEILKVESKVLIQAQLDLVRHLHVIQTQIARFRRQLTSMLHVGYVIRDQDAQRTQAAGTLTVPRTSQYGGARNPPTSFSAGSAGVQGLMSESMGSAMNRTTPPPPPAPVAFTPEASHCAPAPPAHPDTTPTPPPHLAPQAGYFSPLAKVYMNDVIDHLEFVVACDHLTEYVFNVLSFHTNNSMERLSIVTVVFLPLTFIASYFGMNFEDVPSLDNPDSYFWRVAGPLTVTFFVIFSYSYISQALQTGAGRWQSWRRDREFSQRPRKLDADF